MLMNKKAGEGLELSRWFFNILIVSVVIVFIFLVVYTNLNEDIQVTDMKQEILFKTAAYSASCLAYQDADGIVYPSKIDPEKINTGRLTNCLTLAGTGYKIKLLDINSNTLKEAIVSNNIYDPDKFTICTAIELYKCNLFKQLVFYKKDNTFVQGILEIEVMSIED